jgi:hypothetical protein
VVPRLCGTRLLTEEQRCRQASPKRALITLGYLIEVGQSTGLLAGRLAKKRPEDLPG